MLENEVIHQYGTEGSVKNKLQLSLPDEIYQYGVFDTGYSKQFDKDEVSIEAEQLRGQRKKKPTVKGIEHKTYLMKRKRGKVYARLITKVCSH